ncbi:MAG: CoA ester lyase [Alphaproteobacteria bacterium]|nr:CoA ester lyase [Alphaproteobacteria bacterium]MCB9930496.1 CoA ester lyase [Alphaproteobacteria bacterium]
MPFRTLLFTPGNHPRKVAKVFAAGADAVILDLEDAVAIAEKPATRQAVVAALRARPVPRRPLGYVRVNALSTPFAYGDFQAVVGPWLDGIVLPKVESAAELATAEWLLAQCEREAGLAPGSIDLIPIIETARAEQALDAIAAAATRVRRLSFGAGDYTLDIGREWSLGEGELLPMRHRMVSVSRAAGLEPPLDSVFIHLRETEAFQASCATVRGLGFQGKLCIHPDQIAAANAAFTPTADQVAHAEKIVAAFAAAEAAGSASIQVEGYFVDYPIVEKARRTLALMQAIRAAG